MKFFYILNNVMQLIEFGKIDSERGYLMKQMMFDFEESNLLGSNLYSISLDLNKIENSIDNLLKERNSKSLNNLDYNDKFYQEMQLFKEMRYKDSNFIFCQTGFDSKVIFLINIYNSILKDERPYYLMLTSTHREFEDWKIKNKHEEK